MTRAVLDANVIISALLSKGSPPAMILDAVRLGLFQLALSPAILAELARVLTYPKFARFSQLQPEHIAALLDELASISILVDPHKRIKIVLDDPDDDKYVECAYCAKATYIVSGDKHLLSIERYGAIRIVRPIDFLVVLVGAG